jgi:hypothetical protein
MATSPGPDCDGIKASRAAGSGLGGHFVFALLGGVGRAGRANFIDYSFGPTGDLPTTAFLSDEQQQKLGVCDSLRACVDVGCGSRFCRLRLEAG